MAKFIIYTSNLDLNPKTMEDVITFAKENAKFRIANVELNPSLARVKAGDHIITKKHNNVYVIRTFDRSLEDLSAEDRKYVDDLTRHYGLKTCSITGVDTIIKFESWCRSAELISNNKTKTEMETKNSIGNLSARLKERFLPTEVKNVRVAHNGNLCVATPDGYVAIEANGDLVSYPEEFTFDFPVYTIAKPKEALVVGDIIEKNGRYYKITKIEDGNKICTIGYNGVGHSIHSIKDFFLGASERVVVSLAGNLAGGAAGLNNPLLMAALMDNKGGDSIEKLLMFSMMNQAGGNITANPMMAYMLLGKDGGSFKDIALMSALGGGNLFGGAAAAPAGGLFGNLFGTTAAPAAPATPAAKKPAARKAAKKPAPAVAAAPATK